MIGKYNNTMTNTEHTIRTDEQILTIYDENYPKFEWFILFYFGARAVNKLAKAREMQNVPLLMSILNTIWYELPDSQFNIKENPAGWTEFLEVIEE